MSKKKKFKTEPFVAPAEENADVQAFSFDEAAAAQESAPEAPENEAVPFEEDGAGAADGFTEINDGTGEADSDGAAGGFSDINGEAGDEQPYDDGGYPDTDGEAGNEQPYADDGYPDIYGEAEDEPEEDPTYPENGEQDSYEEEAEYSRPDYSYLKPAPGTYPYVPYTSRFAMLFGKSRFYGVMTIITAVYSFFWTFMYYFMLAERGYLFSEAEKTMQARGETVYTMTFSSPLITVLRIMMYVLPVLLIIWTVAVTTADKKRSGMGKKVIAITVLCLVVFLGITAVFDIFGAGLLFETVVWK